MTKGKVAIVTGSSRGIGRAIAVAIAKVGVSVLVTYKTNRALAMKVVEDIVNQGGRALAAQMSVEDRDSVKQTIAQANNSFGTVDILVNNAAVAQKKQFGSITDTDWDSMMAVNLRGPFICCQEVLPAMIEKGYGRIINIASIGGQWGGVNQIHYAAAKAGLINLTKSLAKVYSRYGITVNAVSPGLVSTDMTKNDLGIDISKEKFEDIPIGRIATADEIANAVVFLCSDSSSYITGQTLNVNGGMYSD